MGTCILNGCYEFKEIGKVGKYVRLLCSAKSGSIAWLEELKNEQGAIVIQYDGRLMLSENMEHFKDCDGDTFPENTIGEVDKLMPPGIAYFRRWDHNLNRIVEVLLLPDDYYRGHYNNRYRIMSSTNNMGYPALNLYDLYVTGDLNAEINSICQKKVECVVW